MRGEPLVESDGPELHLGLPRVRVEAAVSEGTHKNVDSVRVANPVNVRTDLQYRKKVDHHSYLPDSTGT